MSEGVVFRATGQPFPQHCSRLGEDTFEGLGEGQRVCSTGNRKVLGGMSLEK